MSSHTHSHTRRRRAPALSVLTLALLGVMSMPAWAADPICLDEDGNPTFLPSNEGNEDGQDNAPCKSPASAYGEGNNASGSSSGGSTRRMRRSGRPRTPRGGSAGP